MGWDLNPGGAQLHGISSPAPTLLDYPDCMDYN